MFDTAGEPDGLLLKACGTRRAARCPPCAEVYRADAYQLLRAGLAGGKGIPHSISGHPRLFVTFTAPSFGPVHSSRIRRGGSRRSGPPGSMPAAPTAGPAAVLPVMSAAIRSWAPRSARTATTTPGPWSGMRWPPRLWKRTTIYLRRALAREAGLTGAQFRAAARVSYVKVAEYQARGAVHLHAIIRLDGPDPHTPPPGWASAELLAAAALRHTAAQVAVPDPLGGPAARWGDQLDLRPIHPGTGEWSAGKDAGYLAKYATKATEGLGAALDQPIGSLAQLERLALPDHTARLVRACWTLARQPATASLGLRRWAHMLGYGGHCLTKSRQFAATMGALRAARRAWTARRHHGPTISLDQDRPAAAARRHDQGGGLAVRRARLHHARRRLAGRQYGRRPPPGTPARPRGAEPRCLTQPPRRAACGALRGRVREPRHERSGRSAQ